MKKISAMIALLMLFSASLAWSQTVTQATVDAKQAEVARLQNELQNAQAEAYQAYTTNAPDLNQKQAKVNNLQSQLNKAQNEAYQAMQQLVAQNQQNQYQAQNPYQNQFQTQSQPFANQQYSGSGDNMAFFQVSQLIENGLEDNQMQIASLSSQLSPDQKMMLYNKYEKGAGGPFALNFFIGWGIGSYVQGDGKGGAFQTVTEGIGWILMLVGVSGEEISTGPLAVGAICMSVGQIYGWFRPFVFRNNYNKTLQNSLNGQSQMMFSLAPIIDPIDDKYGLMAKINL